MIVELPKTMQNESKKIKKFFSLTAKGFEKHSLFTYAAGIAFYTIFSLPGLVITIITLASIFLDQSQVEMLLLNELKGLVGPDSVETVKSIIRKIDFSESSVWRTIFGIGTLVFSATTIFVSLQEALNKIWDIKVVSERASKNSGIVRFLLDRVLSFGMIASLGFILLVTFVIDSSLEVLLSHFHSYLGQTTVLLANIIGFLLSLLTTFVFVFLVFRFLPYAKLNKKEVVRSTIITTVLMILGKVGIDVYLANSSFKETYDAAGSIIVTLIWVYYSAFVLLLGAEISRTTMLFSKENKS